jgi:hypothetical protein
MFTPLFTPKGQHSLLFIRMEGRTKEFHLQGITSPLRDKVHSWGQSRPGVESLPLGAKLRMGLRMLSTTSQIDSCDEAHKSENCLCVFFDFCLLRLHFLLLDWAGLHLYMHTRVCTCIHGYVHAYMGMSMYTWVCTCIHGYVHTCKYVFAKVS